jgi:subtilisin
MDASLRSLYFSVKKRQRAEPIEASSEHAHSLVERSGSMSVRPQPSPRLREEFADLRGRGVRVAIIDSGWDTRGPYKGIRVENGRAFCSIGAPDSFSTVNDELGHGTACITTLHRLAPAATLCPVRIFGLNRSTSMTTLCSAVRWAVRQGFDIINLSAGSFGKPGRDAVIELYRACEVARRQHTVIVAATEMNAVATFPAAFDNVLSVFAGPYDNPFDFQYRGNERAECFAACGINRQVYTIGGSLNVADGPSYAAPVISGIVALLRERHEKAPLEFVRHLLAKYSIEPAAS